MVNIPFAGIDAWKVLPLRGDRDEGTGFAFESSATKCQSHACILTARHVVRRTGVDLLVTDVEWSATGGAVDWDKLVTQKIDENADLDIAVVKDTRGRAGDLTRWEIAPIGTKVTPGEQVRVVVIGYIEESIGQNRHRNVAYQHVLGGWVSNIIVQGGTNRHIMLSMTVLKGHSGGVVLNENNLVVGLLTKGLEYHRPGVPVESGPISVAVHVDAIRAQLCEWGYLSGANYCG